MFLFKVDENISLKLIELNDAERVFELIDKSRKYLREWMSWVDSTAKIEDMKEFIRQALKGYAEGNDMNAVILFDGEIVGIAGFNDINWSNKTGKIGYWIGEEFQGKGIMTKVAKALTDYAFSHLQLNKVEIRAAEKNKKSRSIPEKLGFINEGCIRQAEWLYDHYVDHVIYGILAEEWNQI